MHQEEKQGTETAEIFDYWAKSVGDFWGGMTKMSGLSENKADKGEEPFKSQNRYFESLFRTFSEPEDVGGMLKEMHKLPHMSIEMGKEIWESCCDFQKTGFSQARKNGNRFQDMGFSDVDQKIFNIYGKIYEKEFQKFLEVPQLGLNRFKQERVNRFIDRFNLFQKALGEFAHIFYVPMEKSASIMQDKMEEMFEAGEKIDNFKDLHAMWIRILEGQYMEQLKSSDYTQVLNKTVEALADYRGAKDEMLYDFLEAMPIPTNKDMDELYKDLYLLKKKVRKMSAAMENEKGSDKE